MSIRLWLFIGILIAIVTGNIGCSGDSRSRTANATAEPDSGTETPSPSPSTTATPTSAPLVSKLSGFVIDPPIGDATVCIDVNNNFICDPDEPTIMTDGTGFYELDVEAGIIERTKLAIINAGLSYDIGTNEVFPTQFNLNAGPGLGNITALTSYAEFLFDTGQALTREEAGWRVADEFDIELGEGNTIDNLELDGNDRANIANQLLAQKIRVATVAAQVKGLPDDAAAATALQATASDIKQLANQMIIVLQTISEAGNLQTAIELQKVLIVVSANELLEAYVITLTRTPTPIPTPIPDPTPTSAPTGASGGGGGNAF